jgi:hypothetical protein
VSDGTDLMDQYRDGMTEVTTNAAGTGSAEDEAAGEAAGAS